MSIKINFDTANNPESPTLILAYRNGKKIGEIIAEDIVVRDSMINPSEISFKVRKSLNGIKNALWEKVVDFKLVWYKEADLWFEIYVEIDESNETIKNVSCVQLGQAELSQIKLFDTEINTENDIARDDYLMPTILYNATHPEASLLHRIMEKAPHYSIVHVDSTIAKIQRTFTFNDISIPDAFQEIAEEIGCLFVFHSNSDINGKIQRAISVYDLESNCNTCGHRGEFTSICPECGSSNINEGYGEDTTIFVTADELANDIQFVSDTGSIKNCFKLIAGDDLMTATVRNCNPNGTDYIWYISNDVKSDMSKELVSKIESYDSLYEYYQNDYVVNINSSTLAKYNNLVSAYQGYNKDLQKISPPIKGYPSLMTATYSAIDLLLFLESGLMPNVGMSDTSAEAQAALLTRSNLSPVSVTNLDNISLATADSAVLSMAKVVIDPRYRVKINDSSLVSQTWTGNFIVTNYSDEEDTATSATVSVELNDDYEKFVQQKIDKAIKDKNEENLSITGLFKMNYSAFCAELKKYCLNSLNSFHDACQACIDILIEQGIADSKTWADSEENLYDNLYTPYYNKLKAIELEIKVRQDEINIITGVYNVNGVLTQNGLQFYLDEAREKIQSTLDFQNYIGNELWLEFCTYRREDKYANDNYISDGLTNSELFEKALEFIKVAENEIYKSAELQHSISSSLKNLLVMKKFKPLIKYFKAGNWLRIMVDDKVYKLRLLEYEIDFDNIDSLSVEFSDVLKTANGETDQKSIMSKATSIASSYNSVQKQASQGSKSNEIISSWFKDGLDATHTKIINADNQSQTWDSHGMLFRRYDDIIGGYEDTQLKIINSTMAITDDNWKSTKTAVGAYYYVHPVTGKLTMAYGINAEVLVGRLILGEQLGLYNDSGSLSFDNNGLLITNGINSFKVNPNSEVLLAISNSEKDVFWVDSNGKLHISGDGSGLDISSNSDITDMKSLIMQNAEGIRMEVTNRQNADTELRASIKITAEQISSEVTNRQNADNELRSSITQTAEEIRSEVEAGDEGLESKITQTASEIRAELANEVEGLETKIDLSAGGVTSTVNDRLNSMQTQIDQNTTGISAEVINRQNADNELRSSIKLNAEAIELRVTNDEMSSAITESADNIRLEIKSNVPEKLKNTYVNIDTSGIKMYGQNIELISGDISLNGGNISLNGGSNIDIESGGSVKINSGASVVINSEGTVQISGNENANSYIDFGEAFSASIHGVSGTNAEFETLKVGGKNVLTGPNLNSQIVVSESQPSGNGVIWLQPSTFSSVAYQVYTGDDRNSSLCLFSEKTLGLEPQNDGDAYLADSTFNYKLSFRVINIGNKIQDIKVFAEAKKSDTGETISFGEFNVGTLAQWGKKTVELYVNSTNTNLCKTGEAINVTIRASSDDVAGLNYLYVDRQQYVTLTATDQTASGSIQACNVYYIP